MSVMSNGWLHRPSRPGTRQLTSYRFDRELHTKLHRPVYIIEDSVAVSFAIEPLVKDRGCAIRRRDP